MMRTTYFSAGFLRRGAGVLAVGSMSLLSAEVRSAPPTQAGPHPAATADDAASSRRLPAWREVEALVSKQLAKSPDYQSGDILSRGQVRPLLAALTKAGWKVSDAKDIEALVLDDQDFVVRQLRTKEGRKTMRKISGTPGAYDRLHRLAETAGGDRQVTDLLRLPNANDVIAALAQSKAGRDISRRLASGPRTGEYDKPTGYLYTEAQLLTRLRESHARDQGAAR